MDTALRNHKRSLAFTGAFHKLRDVPRRQLGKMNGVVLYIVAERLAPICDIIERQDDDRELRQQHQQGQPRAKA